MRIKGGDLDTIPRRGADAVLVVILRMRVLIVVISEEGISRPFGEFFRGKRGQELAVRSDDVTSVAVQPNVIMVGEGVYGAEVISVFGNGARPDTIQGAFAVGRTAYEHPSRFRIVSFFENGITVNLRQVVVFRSAFNTRQGDGFCRNKDLGNTVARRNGGRVRPFCIQVETS